jgi:uncharacterized surface protein with fasciclin (FAS1) repeats
MKSLIVALTMFLSSQLTFASDRLQTDVVETAVAAPNFKTLVAAVKAAGLVEALKAHGPLTVFAPNDTAFSNLPQGSIELLLGDKATLTKVLTYHVARGEFDVPNFSGTSLLTLQGQRVKISKIGPGLFVNDSKIISIIKVKNGQIVVLDSVLRPF